MESHTKKNIPLTDLHLNGGNPRFDFVTSQRDTIKSIIEDQGIKIINLANHIIEFGINPSEIPIVSPSETEKGMFVVLEGNRRVATLKILLNPELIDDSFKSIKAKIKELSKKLEKGSFDEVECIAYENPEDAHEWIKLKHTGENEGVGTVRWDAQQVARFEARVVGKSAIGLQAIEFLKKSPHVSEEIKKNINRVKITNLDRLITDKNVQDVLSIAIEDGKIRSDLSEKEVAKGLSKIARDLISKKIKVKDIYTKTDRENYIETFHKNDIPNKGHKSKALWELTSPQGGVATGAGSRKPLRDSTARKTVIPRDCVLKIKEKRINKIYLELKRIDVKEFENAVAVLLRVFIELSMDAYLEKHTLPRITKDSKLRIKVEGVAQHFEENSVLTRSELKGIRTAVSNSNSVLSIDTFNAYVHNKHMSPSAKDLNMSWDNYQVFITKLWESI